MNLSQLLQLNFWKLSAKSSIEDNLDTTCNEMFHSCILSPKSTFPLFPFHTRVPLLLIFVTNALISQSDSDSASKPHPVCVGVISKLGCVL